MRVRKMMKIAIFTGTILLTRSDARSIYAIEILRHLIKLNDLDITVVSPNDISSEFKHAVKYERYILIDRRHFRKLSAMISSFFKLLEINCDLIHCYEREAVVIALLTRRLRKRRIPIIFEVMGLEVGESEVNARKSFLGRILRPYTIWKERMLLKQSDGIFALTEAVREYIVEHYNVPGSKVFTIPHGVDVELFARERRKDEFLVNQLGLRNKKVILYTGAILPLNGVFDLVKAMKIVNLKIKDVMLVVVGAGSLETTIKKYIKTSGLDNVIFTGQVPHKEIPRYHSIADILVNPDAKCLQTELDAPTKLFEYLASGKPIVSSNLRSIADIVGDNAVLVEPENPQSIAEGILTLLNDEEMRKKIGENGKKLVFEYTWEKAANRTYDGYKTILNTFFHRAGNSCRFVV
jgi:glycosyltransferase involved in cell wall biosynthesis